MRAYGQGSSSIGDVGDQDRATVRCGATDLHLCNTL